MYYVEPYWGCIHIGHTQPKASTEAASLSGGAACKWQCGACAARQGQRGGSGGGSGWWREDGGTPRTGWAPGGPLPPDAAGWRAATRRSTTPPPGSRGRPPAPPCLPSGSASDAPRRSRGLRSCGPHGLSPRLGRRRAAEGTGRPAPTLSGSPSSSRTHTPSALFLVGVAGQRDCGRAAQELGWLASAPGQPGGRRGVRRSEPLPSPLALTVTCSVCRSSALLPTSSPESRLRLTPSLLHTTCSTCGELTVMTGAASTPRIAVACREMGVETPLEGRDV